MKSWHGNRSPFGSWHSSRGGVTFADFLLWFLASGTWDDAGVWVDAIWLWDEDDAPFFLASGRFNVYGVWDDDEELWA